MAFFNIDGTLKNIFKIGKKLERIRFRSNSGIAEYCNYNGDWREFGVYKEKTVDAGNTEIVDDFLNTRGDSCLWQYNVKNGLNLRAGTVACCWDSNGNVSYNEVSTSDIGDTDDIEIKINYFSNDVVFSVENKGLSDGWVVKTKRSIL